MLRSCKNGVTSQVNTERFIDAFTKSLEAGEDILYIGFSSALSGTCSSAMLAANLLKDKFPDRKIYIVDSLCASLGQGLLIHQAVAPVSYTPLDVYKRQGPAWPFWRSNTPDSPQRRSPFQSRRYIRSF